MQSCVPVFILAVHVSFCKQKFDGFDVAFGNCVVQRRVVQLVMYVEILSRSLVPDSFYIRVVVLLRGSDDVHLLNCQALLDLRSFTLVNVLMFPDFNLGRLKMFKRSCSQSSVIAHYRNIQDVSTFLDI